MKTMKTDNAASSPNPESLLGILQQIIKTQERTIRQIRETDQRMRETTEEIMATMEQIK